MTQPQTFLNFFSIFSGYVRKTRDIRGKMSSLNEAVKWRFYCVFKPKHRGFDQKRWYGRLGLNHSFHKGFPRKPRGVHLFFLNFVSHF